MMNENQHYPMDEGKAHLLLIVFRSGSRRWKSSVLTTLIPSHNTLSQIQHINPTLLLNTILALAVILAAVAGLDIRPSGLAVGDNAIGVIESELGVAFAAAFAPDAEDRADEETEGRDEEEGFEMHCFWLLIYIVGRLADVNLT
jgi:hypothetical protein